MQAIYSPHHIQLESFRHQIALAHDGKSLSDENLSGKSPIINIQNDRGTDFAAQHGKRVVNVQFSAQQRAGDSDEWMVILLGQADGNHIRFAEAETCIEQALSAGFRVCADEANQRGVGALFDADGVDVLADCLERVEQGGESPDPVLEKDVELSERRPLKTGRGSGFRRL